MSETNLETTIISRRTLVKGEVQFTGPAIVGGRIEGNVSAPESLQITAEGSLEGDLQGTVVDIQGKVKGNIVATQACWLRPTARVAAELRATTLAIEEGACFVGPVCVGGTRATIEDAIDADDADVRTAGNFHRELTEGDSEPAVQVFSNNVQRVAVAAR
ncbi:MAG TPA: polymer-forming cytoskeletal protein [Phycisphaerae bacterium]|nr:polymer-forming cytoskeletal protein [Phycisphaerae bacterium]